MLDNINGVAMCRKEKEKLTFIIEILRQGNETWQGVLHWKERSRRNSFRSALEMVRIMDFMLCPDVIKEDEESIILPILTSNESKQATFVVEIMYQQHTTWQGLVTWLDKDKKQFFRSVLELMRLIESALKPQDVREFADKLDMPVFPFSKKLTIDELEVELSSI